MATKRTTLLPPPMDGMWNEEDDIAATMLTNASVDEIPAQLAVDEDCCEQVVGLSEQW